MLTILASGTLVRDPERRTGANGRAFATALLRVPSEDADAILASLVAFSDTAIAALTALSRGDSLAVTGRAKLTSWTKAGEEHRGLSVVVDQVLTLYAIEKKRKRSAGDTGEPARAPASDPAPETRQPAPTRTGNALAGMPSDIPF